MIRIDAIWLATEPMDMRAGTETALARVIAVFGAAKPHCAYLFANRRANRMKVLVHDGVGREITSSSKACLRPEMRQAKIPINGSSQTVISWTLRPEGEAPLDIYLASVLEPQISTDHTVCSIPLNCRSHHARLNT